MPTSKQPPEGPEYGPFEAHELEKYQRPFQPAPAAEPPLTPLRFIKELVDVSLRSLVISLLLIWYVMQGTVVYGHSMEPNFFTDERVFVEKVSYQFVTPQRGDVVVVDLQTGEPWLIKRAIGLPGETVEIRNNQLFIDGQPQIESYLPPINQSNYGPITVPEGEILVMGDNRNVSRDSRAFGPIELDQVVGRAWLRFWPLDAVGLVD